MRVSLLFFLMLFGFCYGQKSNTLSLGLCDTIPADLYTKRYLKHLSVHNGQGYCHSPVKVLSAGIANLIALESLYYHSNDTSKHLPSEVKALRNLTQLSTNDIIPEIAELTGLKSLNLIVTDKQELQDLKALSFE